MLPWLPTPFSLLGILMILDGSWQISNKSQNLCISNQVSKYLHLKPKSWNPKFLTIKQVSESHILKFEFCILLLSSGNGTVNCVNKEES